MILEFGGSGFLPSSLLSALPYFHPPPRSPVSLAACRLFFVGCTAPTMLPWSSMRSPTYGRPIYLHRPKCIWIAGVCMMCRSYPGAVRSNEPRLWWETNQKLVYVVFRLRRRFQQALPISRGKGVGFAILGSLEPSILTVDAASMISTDWGYQCAVRTYRVPKLVISVRLTLRFFLSYTIVYAYALK